MYYVFCTFNSQTGYNSYATYEEAKKDAEKYASNGFHAFIIKGDNPEFIH